MFVAEADGEAVPHVDRADGEGQRDELVVGEPGADFLVDGVRRGTLRDQGQGLGPGQRRPLARRVEAGRRS
jgi:hypothetical protein